MDCDRRRSGHSRVCRKAHARLGPTGGRPSAGGFPAQLARNGLMAARYTVEQLRARVGQELGVSEWLQVEQHLIDGFGRATRDPDPLHMDPEWAARKTHCGGTIAFGFWTLSMLTCFSHEIPMWPVDVDYALNSGLDRIQIGSAHVGTPVT